MFDPLREIKKTHRHLPHWTMEGAIYWITFHLADSLPAEKLRIWKSERDAWLEAHPKPWSDSDWTEYGKLFGERFEVWLDQGYGSCALRDPVVREPVKDCILRFDAERLDIHAAVIMPNHVHLLLQPFAGEELEVIMKGIKGASARIANKTLGTKNRFWMSESYDHIVRSEAQYGRFIRYLASNPARARLREGEYWLHLPNPKLMV